MPSIYNTVMTAMLQNTGLILSVGITALLVGVLVYQIVQSIKTMRRSRPQMSQKSSKSYKSYFVLRALTNIAKVALTTTLLFLAVGKFSAAALVSAEALIVVITSLLLISASHFCRFYQQAI